MSDEIRVEKIEIKIGKKMLSLTPAEMKELRDILDATFPKKETVYIPGQPIIIERPRWPAWPWRHWGEPVWATTKTNHGGGYTMRLSNTTSNA